MIKILMEKIIIAITIKFFGFIISGFWKNNKMVYINSNKKRCDIQSVSDLITDEKSYKWIKNDDVQKAKYPRFHLWKSKIFLYAILRNWNNKSELIYSGFVSTPLAVYDGYILGNNKQYTFVDMNNTNNQTYLIKYEKNMKFEQNIVNIPTDTKEVDLLIESSFDINESLCKDYPKYYYKQKSNGIVNTKYLQEIYTFMDNFLNECNRMKVSTIHLYCCCKQPVSFIIGTAIQSYHPKVIAYECFGGKYNTWCLNIQENRMKKVKYESN